MSKLRMGGAVPPLPLYAFMACRETNVSSHSQGLFLSNPCLHVFTYCSTLEIQAKSFSEMMPLKLHGVMYQKCVIVSWNVVPQLVWCRYWLAAWLTDRLIGWLAGWLTGRLTDWLVGWWLAGWQIDWLNDWLGEWLTGWLVDWLTGWLTDWLIGCPTDWLAGWLTGRLTDWLTG